MSTQGALPLPFQPMAGGGEHYVAVLQNRRGERDALRYADSSILDRVTPLLVFRPRGKETLPIGPDTPRNWVRNLSEILRDRPCFIDVENLQRRQLAKQPAKLSAAQALLDAADRQHLCYVPVLSTSGTKRHRELILRAVHACGRGLAIRHRFMGTAASPSRQAAALRALIEEAGIELASVDLLLDAEYLDPDDDIDTAAVIELINEVSKIGAWRNVALIGTSIPATMGCIPEGTLGSIRRAEWALWRAVRAARPRRLPTFGDYAVQHPKRPSSSGLGMRANVRYTLAEQTLVARGKGIHVQNGPREYRELCAWLYQHPDYSGATYSWGDEYIEAVALGHEPPTSGQDRWRGVGTSHHLRFVVDQLA